MRISTYYLTHFRNDEHFQFGAEFQSLVLKSGAAALGIASQFAEWQSLYAQEDAVLKKIVKSAFTDDIRRADRERSMLYRGMVRSNKGALLHYDIAMRDAAKRLQIVFDTYGNVATKPTIEKTSALYNVLEELKSAKFTGDATTVGLTAWLSPLEARNNAVEDLYRSRAHETAIKPTAILKAVRAEIDAKYNELIDIISAKALIEPDAITKGFLHRWSVVIKEYIDAIKQRYGRYAAAAAREKEKSIPPPPK